MLYKSDPNADKVVGVSQNLRKFCGLHKWKSPLLGSREEEVDKKRQEIEGEKEHVALRMKHSAVESGINALQVHGLKKVPDSGIEGYKRYVALGVLGYNIHKLGAILLERHYKQMKKNTA